MQTQEREEDQQVLNLVGEAFRLLGNALVALGDLRCNLSSAPPRHLHVIRPMSYYTSSVLPPGGAHHMPVQVRPIIWTYFMNYILEWYKWKDVYVDMKGTFPFYS